MSRVNNAAAVETGPVEIKNDYSNGEVTIRLYHADALDRVYETWNIGSSQTSTLQKDGKDVIIGGDWIVDIVFGNGVTGKRHLVSKVGKHNNGKWTLNATSIYKDGKE